MPLTLIVGPAGSGKLTHVLDRFLGALEAGAEPVLIVPGRSDVEVVERELLGRRPALLGGRIVTFDELLREVLERCGEAAPILADAQRRTLLAEAVAGPAPAPP